MNPRTEVLREACEQAARESKAVSVAVALLDYEDNFRFEMNAERTFHAASTIKVALLFALFKAIDEGRVHARDPLHVRNHFFSVIDGLPFRTNPDSDGFPQLYRSIGRTARIIDLAKWMITSSSNLATNLLVDYLTPEYARAVLRRAEIDGVELRRGVDDEKAHAAGVNNETSASGMLKLFAALRSDALSKISRGTVINILLHQRFNSMIPAPLPPHASVAHKTGEISTACHDAGIVYLPERQPYVLVILTEVKPEANCRRETVANISKIVFECLTGQGRKRS
jgi:beta-lactamase class A